MAPRAETAAGTIEGLREDDLSVFRGVPFAQPPVGKRRFRAPEPVAPWAGVRPATEFGSAAPQSALRLQMLGFDITDTDEDCLYLNVWTPSVDDGSRPVMVWIHGGAFTIGAGSQSIYDGARLARRGDVVVVTVNYRLGALGFLQIDAEGFDTNLGIRDQIAALEWVRDNIAAFGGDPTNVTIFGESAGGMSVGTLLGSPAAAGLFHRAIPQSGAAHNAHDPGRAGEAAHELLSELDLPSPSKLVDVPTARLLEAQERVSLRWMLQGGVALAFQPSVDDDVVPRVPIESIVDGLARDVSVLVGTTLDEMKLFAMMDPTSSSIDEAAMIDRCARVAGEHGETLARAYLDNRAGAGHPEVWQALFTDYVFRLPAVRLAEAHARHQADTFMYLFTWSSPAMGGALGACHAIDIPFVFGNFVDMMGAFAGDSPEARALSDQVMDAWVAFARAGDPNHPGLPEWPSYEADRRATMLLGRECTVEDDPARVERLAWEGLL